MSNSIIRLSQYVRVDGFPRDTGQMIESAVHHIRLSPVGPNFNLDVFFDREYAAPVHESEKHKDYLTKRVPRFIEIIKQELLFAFQQEGFDIHIG